MRKHYLRTILLLPFLLAGIYLALSQKSTPAYQTLLDQYAEAQLFYNKATNLSDNKNYGEKEERLEEDWNKKALLLFTKLYHEIPTALPLYDSLRFHTGFKIGELQHYFENFSEAIRFYKVAIAAKEKKFPQDSSLFKPYLYSGIIFYNQNKFDTALQFFKKAETIQASYPKKLAEGERLYNILGVLFYERGNYKQAQNYFQKALDILPLSHPYYDALFVNYKINLAQMHLRLEEYDKANEIYRQLESGKTNLNEINHNIGSLNLSLGAAAKAIRYFRKVSYQNNKIVRLYNSMGEAFFNLSQMDSALHYYQKATKAYHDLGPNADLVGYGLVLKNRGHYATHTKKYSEALAYFQQALHSFYPAFHEKNVHANPENYSGVFSYIHLFHTLHAKAETWHQLYLSTKNISAAKEELKVYQSAFKLVEYVEKTYDSDEARLFLTKTKHAVHGKPIDIAFELYTQTKEEKYLESLYYFDQQNKAAILVLNRQRNTTGSERTSPALQKEQEIKTEITRLSIRASQLADSGQIALIHKNIRDLEMELGKLQENLHSNAAVKNEAIPSIAHLQNELLDNKTALVSYHLSDHNLTVLLISQTQRICYQKALPEQFIEKMLERIRQTKTPLTESRKEENLNFFDLFLSNVPIDEFDQLVIIPDDILAYFPFESLQDKGGKYLVEKLAVQYQFSTALLEKNETDFANASTLAFAPFAHQSFSDSLAQLHASAREIAISKGQQFFDTAATKANFLENCGAFKILHLATHAVANNSSDDLSYIAFWPTTEKQDHLLYAQEIYNLPLKNTGLVILSACETGTGQLVKGEGVLSLSRAFSYAGCPNIITSLWKADDYTTAILISRIYHYLNEGLSISKAVQKAKVDYLKDKTINPRLKHPYYWSHLVFIGNYSSGSTFHWEWLALAGMFGLLLLVMLLKKSRRSRH